jgi:hypothetical protein
VKKDAWTGAEDDKLMRLHDTLGPRWSNISKMLTGRTAQQCRARWFQLSAADDDATDGNASDATDGATVVTVTVGAAGDEKRDGNAISRKKKMGGAEKKTHSENMSPSTPSVTEEAGTVSAGTAAGVAAGASSRKRVDKLAEKKEPKRRKMLKDAFSAETGAEGAETSGAEYYGNGGGLDMLAMLYSAAVTYEQGVAAVTGSAPSLPAELHA